MSNGVVTTSEVVVPALLSRFPFTSYTSFVEARTVLGEALRKSMGNPALYGLDVQAHLPPDSTDIAAHVHPYNIAASIIVVSASASRWGDALALQEDLQVWNGLAWTRLYDIQMTQAYEMIAGPPVATTPVVPPATTTAIPQPPTNAPTNTQPPAQLGALSPLAITSIDPSREGSAGRPAKSTFEKVHARREKLGTMPFWWKEFAEKLPALLVTPPLDLVDNKGNGPCPGQIYTLMVETVRRSLSRVDGSVTVDQIRAWTSDVLEQIERSPSRETAFDMTEFVYSPTQEATK